MSSAAFVKLEEGGSRDSFTVSRVELMALMEERSTDLLKKMTGGGVVQPTEALCRMLGSHASDGLQGDDLSVRKAAYGANAFAEKKLKSYIELVCDGLHDFLLQLLIGMAIVSYIVETLFGDHPETGWIESAAIVISVAIIVNVSASTDYVKERSFQKLSATLNASNKKVVTRHGVHLEVEDDEIVVGDLLSFNAHNLASIPCDGLMVSGSDVKMDEASLTGEPEPQVRNLPPSPAISRHLSPSPRSSYLVHSLLSPPLARVCPLRTPGQGLRAQSLCGVGDGGGRG